jgi:hypothetical protein
VKLRRVTLSFTRPREVFLFPKKQSPAQCFTTPFSLDYYMYSTTRQSINIKETELPIPCNHNRTMVASATTEKDNKKKARKEEEEDDDKDYAAEDADADGGEQQMDVEEGTNPTNGLSLSHGKRKAVDESFERMFGYKWGTEFDLNESSLNSGRVQMLVQIFGTTKAAQILGSASIGGKRRKIDHPAALSSLPAAFNLPKSKPRMVTETKIFAGQAIQVQRQEDQKPKANSATRSNLDNVLAQLAGPDKISTVQKTSEDWETFKQSDKQLQEELEKKAQGKDAFLVKKDFEKRVDHRQFELEREERNRDRAKRGT